MKILGFCGPAGSGKSTAAKCAACYLDDSVLLSFARPLKEIAKSIGWNGVKDERGRRLLQLLGTDVCRNCIDTNYWINKMRQQLDDCSASFALIDDVRFDNETYVIHDYDGVVIEVRLAGVDYSNHASEQRVNEKYIDYVINCEEKSVAGLFESTQKVLRKMELI